MGKSRTEYWRDWYWNRGGREKTQARRKKTDAERIVREMEAAKNREE